MNYFELYELPVSFSVDEIQLKKKYLELSKKYHPDFFVNETEEKQNEILQLATRNTNAFNTLSDFDKRMKYVLELKNILHEGENYELPKEFLFDMMEVNEELMELESENNETKIKNFNSKISSLQESFLSEVKPVLENKAENSSADLLRVKEYFFKRKYLLRIQERINKFAAS